MEIAAGIIASIFFSLLPFLLIGGVIYAIVAARRREQDDEEVDPGIGTVRRVFFYGIAFVGIMLAGWGLTLLVGGALDAVFGDTVVADSETELAAGLALTLVGAVAWLIFWRVTERALEAHPVERRSMARRTYVGLVRAVSLVVIAVSAVLAIRWALGAGSFNGTHWAMLAVWGAIWGLHERIAANEAVPSESTRTLEELYRYFGAILGLSLLASGFGGVLFQLLQAAYESLFESTFVSPSVWSDSLWTATAIAVTGGATWWWHWLRVALNEPQSSLWRVYIFLFGVLGGLVAALLGTAIALHAVLQWFLAEPDAATAAAHFDVLPGALSAIVAGAGVWSYHRAVLGQRPLDADGMAGSESERAYRYIVAAGGLVTLAAGLATVFAVAVDALTPESNDVFRSAGWWSNPLVVGLTLLAVGVPLWARYWLDLQRRVAAAGAAERTVLSRRAYIFGVFGIAGLVTLVNLTIVLFRFFEAILEGSFSGEVVQDTRWGIALLLSAGAVGVYHWLVLREDRAALELLEPEAPPARAKQVVLLVPGPGDALRLELDRRLGGSTRLWRRLDGLAVSPALSAEALESLETQIGAVESDRITVVVAADGSFEVIPYTVAVS